MSGSTNVNTKGNANREYYDSLADGVYSSTAPHLRHAAIRRLYDAMVKNAFDIGKDRRDGRACRVLDIGAGDGIATASFLRLGAHVMAVDVSERQLQQLQVSCKSLPGQLTIRCADIDSILEEDAQFDIIVANSLLHHIPDYLDLIQRCISRLSADGVFFSFQDPMWRASMSRRDACLSWMAYVLWRLRQGDVLGGIWRRVRRMTGIYSPDSLHDNVEYHAVRDGVDQERIAELLSSAGFICEIARYCSFHSEVVQPFGEWLAIRNTFGIVAMKSLPLDD